ncbi:MAG: hypothetical protein GY863_24925 [bacterium]|nr:hypothetical protein [bacterium]
MRTSYWYGNIYVDPVNENKVWIMGTMLDVSIDGGRTFNNSWTARNIHVDHHCLWINPENTDHMLLGNDGGFYISYDGAKNWDFINNIPIAQFYAIGLDNRDPFWVYGGLQDNGTWGIPSKTYDTMGILNEDAIIVGGGDGFVPAIDPRDHNVVFAESQFGYLNVVDLETLESKQIRPVPEDTTEQYRFTWNSPLIISPHDPDVLYFGGNKLFKTEDKGENWDVISPDLTRNQDKGEWTILDMKPSLRAYNALTAIEESPLRKGVIYVGTDDGRVHVTKDEGGTWEDLTDKFRFSGRDKYVTKIYASMHDAETAFISFTGHFNDDYKPYLFKTDDLGRSWKSITGDMPAEAVVKVVIEHPDNPDILFAGIHNGLLVSFNGGKNWIRTKGNLPCVSVDDIEIKNDDLVLGTYGRGIMIMDDIRYFAEIDKELLETDAVLFSIKDSEKFYRMGRRMFPGVSEFTGDNPDYGALITYYLKDEPQEDSEGVLNIEVIDSEGKVIRTLEGPDGKGFHRISWDLRKVDESASNSQQRRRRGPRYTNVDPGEYTVKLTVRGQELTQSVRVIEDKRK